MEPKKKILLSLPASLADALRQSADRLSISRSELIRRILSDHMKETAKQELIQQMRDGYQSMGEVNLRLAEEALPTDAEQIMNYEQILSECD